MRAPTAVEPVKPILSSVPARSACSSPSKVARPWANTMFSTPSGRPEAWISSKSAIAEAAAYSAGFQTTVLPVTRAGMTYQEGTPTGKFPSVTTGAIPTGTRKVNSCLSGISLGTVWPYSRRPSPRKKSQVSMISWTSPSASGYGLPSSRVTRRASASLLASTIRPIAATVRPRTGAGMSAHSGCACFAAAQAAAKMPASARVTLATTSVSREGLDESATHSADPGAGRPLMVETMLRAMVTGFLGLVSSLACASMGGGGARIPEPAEGPVESLQAGGQLLCGDRQRWPEPDRPRAARQQQDLLLLAQDPQQGVAFRGARQVEGAHQPAPPDVRDQPGETAAQLLQLHEEPGTGGRHLAEQPVALDDLQHSAGADHVGQAPAPGRVDPAADREHVVGHLVHAAPGHDAPQLHLLAERHDVGLEPELLVGPRRPGQAHPGLHLAEDEQRIVVPA